jgi:aspartyl-tRNA(Asn)/glutamyl-tRNA(Gln) amidotransferase subunit A
MPRRCSASSLATILATLRVHRLLSPTTPPKATSPPRGCALACLQNILVRVSIKLPHTKYAVPTYYLVATAEASANLARFDGVRYGYRSPNSATLSDMYSYSRDEGFGAEVKRRIFLGTYALSAGYYDAYYLKAQQVRRILAEEFLRAFAEVDAIVTPTSPVPAFKLGEKTGDPLAMYLADIYTVTASLAGICGVSVPCGETRAGLPVGMQVLALHFGESTAFRVARAVEAAGIQ